MTGIVIAVVLTLVIAVPVTFFAAITYRKKIVEDKLGNAEEKAREIALSLELFTTGSLDIFGHRSTVQLDRRIVKDLTENANKDYANVLALLLPRKLIPVAAQLTHIKPTTKANQITREQRAALVSLLKGYKLTVRAFRPVEEAIVTSGGVKVSEIDPRTMESKKIKGLYFAGEVLDLDALTGGYNLQIAWSTGYLAGVNAGES